MAKKPRKAKQPDRISKRGRVNEGAPLSYDPKYCQEIISMMKTAYEDTESPRNPTLAQFAASIGVSRPTVNRWRKEHEEFFYASELALTYAEAKHDQIGQTWMIVPVGEEPKRFNTKLHEQVGRNRFGHSDALKLTTEDEDGNKMPLQSVSPADLLASWDKLQKIKAGMK